MRNRKLTWRTVAIVFVLIFLLFYSLLKAENYLLPSLGIAAASFILLLVRFENRKVEPRELVLLAVLAAIAAVGRIPFAAIPGVQPVTFVIIMTGFVFGAESGFLVGAVAALASNMILGQGPWTPWQMAAWGLIGLTAGLLRKNPVMNTQIGRAVFGFLSAFLFGWIMNLWGFFAFAQNGGEQISLKALWVYFAASGLFDLLHAVSNVFFLLVFGNLWIRSLARFKRKYGLLE